MQIQYTRALAQSLKKIEENKYLLPKILEGFWKLNKYGLQKLDKARELIIRKDVIKHRQQKKKTLCWIHLIKLGCRVLLYFLNIFLIHTKFFFL